MLTSTTIIGCEVLQSPREQSVVLNSNASFTCTTSYATKWVINGSHNETMVTLLPVNGVPKELSERGFITFSSPRESDDDVYNNTLIVLGSLENNNTEIDCQLKLGQTEVDVPPATLTVIGMFMNITAIICYKQVCNFI